MRNITDNARTSYTRLLDTLKGKGTHQHIVSAMETILSDNHTKNGTARDWFEAHHNQPVDTIQVQALGPVFSPLGRVVDAESYKGKVTFNNASARDYGGLTVLHASDNVLFVSYNFNGDSYALYVVSE